ncbi:MAG TPA: hypothetical protein VJY64_01350 [Candidatus Onthovivens sp.]|nr:hypothetical protein [Candidatus Onthovivens sp.]
MAILKTKKAKVKIPLLEENPNLTKLVLFVTIINHTQAESVVNLTRKFRSSASFIENGSGTAEREVLDILGINDDDRDVIFSFIREDMLSDFKKELDAFFMASKKNRGIGFSIPLTSIIGVKIYQFLTDSR